MTHDNVMNDISLSNYVNLPWFLPSPMVVLRFVHGCDLRKESRRRDNSEHTKRVAKQLCHSFCYALDHHEGEEVKTPYVFYDEIIDWRENP